LGNIQFNLSILVCMFSINDKGVVGIFICQHVILWGIGRSSGRTVDSVMKRGKGVLCEWVGRVNIIGRD
jgi:hypothetical protein